MSFTVFIGIDQTGAVKANGQPKPLNVSVIDARETKVIYLTGLKIEKLCYDSVSKLLLQYLTDFKNERVLICVDTVFGLPTELNVGIDQIFIKSKNYSFSQKQFGAQTAFHFFNQFIDGKQTLPSRQVELLVNANSVFKLQPYQKNIGCGSYRIIKELASDTSWFQLWPFDSNKSQYTICEGYPSFFWKNLLHIKTRDLTQLKVKFKNLTFKNIDQADSFVLAYGAMKSVGFMKNFKKNSINKSEGWILGVPQ